MSIVVSMNNDPKTREYYLQRYALAQYHMGITIPLQAKRVIVGNGYLHKATIAKLTKLLKYLRVLYHRNN